MCADWRGVKVAAEIVDAGGAALVLIEADFYPDKAPDVRDAHRVFELVRFGEGGVTSPYVAYRVMNVT